MKINNIEIAQDNNFYLLLSTSMRIAELAMPPDFNYMRDGKALTLITRVMDLRWNYVGKTMVGNQRCTQQLQQTYNNITVVQNDNVYQLYLPNQVLIGILNMPPDGMYMADCQALDVITMAMAVRWGFNQKHQQTGK